MLPNIFSTTKYDAFCEHMRHAYMDTDHALIFEHELA